MASTEQYQIPPRETSSKFKFIQIYFINLSQITLPIFMDSSIFSTLAVRSNVKSRPRTFVCNTGLCTVSDIGREGTEGLNLFVGLQILTDSFTEKRICYKLNFAIPSVSIVILMSDRRNDRYHVRVITATFEHFMRVCQ